MTKITTWRSTRTSCEGRGNKKKIFGDARINIQIGEHPTKNVSFCNLNHSFDDNIFFIEHLEVKAYLEENWNLRQKIEDVV